MRILLIFILGIVFYIFFLPLLGLVSEAIEAKVNIYITKCGIKTGENQVKIKDICGGIDSSPMAAIGFHIDSEDSYDDDDDDNDDFCLETSNRRIGF